MSPLFVTIAHVRRFGVVGGPPVVAASAEQTKGLRLRVGHEVDDLS